MPLLKFLTELKVNRKCPDGIFEKNLDRSIPWHMASQVIKKALVLEESKCMVNVW